MHPRILSGDPKVACRIYNCRGTDLQRPVDSGSSPLLDSVMSCKLPFYTLTRHVAYLLVSFLYRGASKIHFQRQDFHATIF